MTNWTRGTQLRSPDAKTYTWGESQEQFHGLTTIRDAVWGTHDVAHGTWVAQEAQRLFDLHERGMNAITTGYIRTAWGYERTLTEFPAAQLIKDDGYLTKHGFRMLGRAADRGSVTHELLYAYGQGECYAPADIKYWVDEKVAEGDGTQPYLCDLEETTAHCLSLNRWLLGTGFRPIIAECFGANRKLGYAFTLDAIGRFGDERCLWHIDAKSRGQIHVEDAFQLAAQWYAEFLGTPGTWNEINMRTLLNKKFARSGILLVTPEKTVLRPLNMSQLPELWKAWKAIVSLYRFRHVRGIFERGILPAKELKAA